jgi:hypothetical protein
MQKQIKHRPDCLCGECNGVPKRAQPRAAAAATAAELEAYEPEPLREIRIKATDRKRPPPCITCARERGDISPHRAEYEARDVATGLIVSYTCDRGVAALLARVLLASLALALFACGGSSSSGDAGDVDGPRWDGGWIVGLVDAGELEPDAGDVDAGELEPDAGDVDAGELEPDAGDVDAGELEPDAGDGDAGELEPCSSERDRRMCHAAQCATLCQLGSNLECCDGTAGQLELCACN